MDYILKRDVTVKECHWLDRDFKKGETVKRFCGATYGCISNDGVACCHAESGPFFELPDDALDVTQKELFTD